MKNLILSIGLGIWLLILSGFLFPKPSPTQSDSHRASFYKTHDASHLDQLSFVLTSLEVLEKPHDFVTSKMLLDQPFEAKHIDKKYIKVSCLGIPR